METLAINRAFSRQSEHYDSDDRQNMILQEMRRQVYDHVSTYLRPDDSILELNAGTGIDALHFFTQGHRVHATDLSDGMIASIKKKIKSTLSEGNFTCEQLSYDHLDKLSGSKFNYVFSNFGGLNCIQDLSKVTGKIPQILSSGAYVTWVIMPPVCLWEMAGLFKGHWKSAFRRWNKHGVRAHLEGEYFKTYYHSARKIVASFGEQFEVIAIEGLCVFTPPPSRQDFLLRRPYLYNQLRKLDVLVRNLFPFNRWADHVIVTMRLK